MVSNHAVFQLYIYTCANTNCNNQTLFFLGFVYVDRQEDEEYIFDSISGKLIAIRTAIDNSSIKVSYANEGDLFTYLFKHSNGKKMNVTYTDNGFIETVDILDEDDNIELTRYIYTIHSHYY